MRRRTRPFHARLPVVLGLLAVAACSTAPEPPRETSSFSRMAAEEVFAAAFENIADKYIDPLAFDGIGLEGLRGLGAIDPAVTAERDDGDVVLMVAGREVRRFKAPAPHDTHGWARMTAEMAYAGRTASQALARADSERVYEAVFDGLLTELDLYSRYAGAEEASRNRAKRDGFDGIGVRYRIDDGRIRLTEVMPGTPAEAAGLQAGDTVTHIDDAPVDELDADAISRRIRGPVHSRVLLTVVRDGDATPFVAEIARAHIVPQTVYASIVNNVAVIRLRSFNQDTARSLERKLRRLLAENTVQGLVLDLRSNPGGLLRQSVEVADLWLSRGQIVSTRGRHPDSLHDYRAEERDLAKGLPLVALVDGKSASAAEIVAAALQDRSRAIVLGTNSFGKGTVQTVIRLPNDGELTLTWSRLVAPSGYVLHGLGVIPVLCTSGDTDKDAPALIEAALQRLPDRTARLRDALRRQAVGEQARRELRAECPSERRSGDFDLTLARRIVSEPPLYDRLLAMTRLPAAPDLARQTP